MRNILEYPMTYEEAIALLTEMKNELLSDGSVGDIRPYAIEWTIEKLLEMEKNDK